MADINNFITQSFSNGEAINATLLGGVVDVNETLGKVLGKLPEQAGDAFLGSFGTFVPGDVYIVTKEGAGGVYFKGGYTQLSTNRSSVFGAWGADGEPVVVPSFLKEAVNLKEFDSGFAEALANLRLPAGSKARGKTPVMYHQLVVVFQGRLIEATQGNMSYFRVEAALIWDMGKVRASKRSALSGLVSGAPRYITPAQRVALPAAVPAVAGPADGADRPKSALFSELDGLQADAEEISFA